MQMTQIAMALAHLHAHGVVHGHIHPVSRPPLVFLFLRTYPLSKALIHIKDDSQATLVHIGAYTVGSHLLHSYTQFIPNQESFIWQAPEFVKMDAPCVPTEEMDVYAFASSLYTVRLKVFFALYLSEAHKTLLEGLYRRCTI